MNLNTNQTTAPSSATGRVNSALSVPIEPSISDSLREALGYLSSMRETQARIRERLTGMGEAGPVDEIPQSVEGLARYVCQSAAILSGESQTILAKL